MHINFLRTMVKELAQSDVPFLSYGQKTATFGNSLKNSKEILFFGHNSRMFSRIELNLSP